MSRLAILAAGIAIYASPAFATPVELTDAQLDEMTAGADFSQSNLVADQAGKAARTDPNLVNPWGVAQSPTGPLWVADNGKGVSTVYSNAGIPQSLVVSIPAPGGGAGAPTGAVFNGNNDFTVSAAGKSGASKFLFATEDGTIAGWSGQVNPTNAVIAVDNSAKGAVYKGVTIAKVGNSDRLYATDFKTGRVEVFDSSFRSVGSFTDPSLPAGFAPFNVQALKGQIYVTFAKQNAERHDDVAGVGNGFVDVFDTSGHLVRKLITRGNLNSPWGMTIAPSGFGQFSGALLVGNFGDGKINAYNPKTGAFLGQVTQSGGKPLTIDGLWSLHPGQKNTNKIVFTAGPNGEKNGLLGTVQPKANVATKGSTTTSSSAGTTQGKSASSTASKVATNVKTAATSSATHH